MPPEKQKREPRLSGGTIGLMLGFAAAFDILEGLIGLVPVAGWIVNIVIDFFVFAVLWLWFVRHKVNFNKTRALVFAGIALLKFIPLIQEFPMWVLDVIAVSLMVRLEDKFNLNSIQQKVKAGKRVAVLMAKNKRIGGLMDKTESGRKLRQQILSSQKKQVTEKEKPTREQIIEKQQQQLNPDRKSPPPLAKTEKTPSPLPEIGKNTRQAIPNKTETPKTETDNTSKQTPTKENEVPRPFIRDK